MQDFLHARKTFKRKDKIIPEIETKSQVVHSEPSENIIRDIEKRSKTSQDNKNELERDTETVIDRGWAMKVQHTNN